MFIMLTGGLVSRLRNQGLCLWRTCMIIIKLAHTLLTCYRLNNRATPVFTVPVVDVDRLLAGRAAAEPATRSTTEPGRVRHAGAVRRYRLAT